MFNDTIVTNAKCMFDQTLWESKNYISLQMNKCPYLDFETDKRMCWLKTTLSSLKQPTIGN